MKFDLRAEVAAERQALREAYLRRPNPRALLAKHTQLVDRTAKALWGEAAVATEAALVATAGSCSLAPTSICWCCLAPIRAKPSAKRSSA